MKELNNKKILVVDDSATMRMLISMTLKKSLNGISVIEAVNGADAIEKLKAHDFDLILTDMNMPEMDGAGLIVKIRKSLNNNLPIVIVTTMGEERHKDLGLFLGANGYITKPVKGHELKETVLKFLTK